MKSRWAAGRIARVKERGENHGYCVNVILMKSCHGRAEGIGCFGQEECFVLSVDAVLLRLYAVAIGFVMHWMAHLRRYVLAMQSAAVKVQSSQNVHGKTETNTNLPWECLSCVHMPHCGG